MILGFWVVACGRPADVRDDGGTATMEEDTGTSDLGGDDTGGDCEGQVFGGFCFDEAQVLSDVEGTVFSRLTGEVGSSDLLSSAGEVFAAENAELSLVDEVGGDFSFPVCLGCERMDVVVLDGEDQLLHLDTDEGFAEAVEVDFAITVDGLLPRTLEVDGDDQTEVLHSSLRDGTLRVWEYDGDAAFTVRESWAFGEPVTAVPLDLEGDGDDDIIVFHAAGSAARAYLNDAGQFLADDLGALPFGSHARAGGRRNGTERITMSYNNTDIFENNGFGFLKSSEDPLGAAFTELGCRVSMGFLAAPPDDFAGFATECEPTVRCLLVDEAGAAQSCGEFFTDGTPSSAVTIPTSDGVLMVAGTTSGIEYAHGTAMANASR